MIREYKQYLSSVKGYSEHTSDAYIRDINHFAKWLMMTAPGARWSTVTRTTIDVYMMALSDQGYSPATINRRLSSIASLYKWMKREGMGVENPCRYESRQKIAKRQPITIDENSIQQVITHAAEDIATAVQVLWATGIRTSELLELHTWDIDYNDQSIEVRCGKGGKDRKVFMDADTSQRLQRLTAGKQGLIWYWSARELRYNVWHAFSQYSQAQQLNPRALRHTFATTMARNGANATTIAALMGHESIKTSQQYIDFAGVTVKEQYLKFKPHTT